MHIICMLLIRPEADLLSPFSSCPLPLSYLTPIEFFFLIHLRTSATSPIIPAQASRLKAPYLAPPIPYCLKCLVPPGKGTWWVFSISSLDGESGAGHRGKEDDGLSSSRFSLGMGSSEFCLPAAQGPPKWAYGVGQEGAPWGAGGQVPVACPRPAPSLLAGSHTSPWWSWLLL